MASKKRYVVTLYSRNNRVWGMYGVFQDAEAAQAFGRVSGAARFRVSLIQKPSKLLFDAIVHPDKEGRRAPS